MWIKKKDYEELVDNIDYLKNEVRRLSECHTRMPHFLCTTYEYDHDLEKVNTNKIKNITLQELAEYVIDNKPIKREEKITKEYYNDRNEIKIEL